MGKKKFQKRWLVYLLCLGLALLAALWQLSVGNPNAISGFGSPVAVRSPAAPARTEVRGVWLTNVTSGVLFAPWGVNRAMRQLSQLNFNTVYPVVWNRGHTFYPSRVAKQVTGRDREPLLGLVRLGQDSLAEIVKQGYRYQIDVIPWFEYGFMAPANSELVRRHPEWVTFRRNNSQILKVIADEQNGIDSGDSTSKPVWENVRQFILKQMDINQVWLNPLHPEVQKFMLDLMVEVVSKYGVAGIQIDDRFAMPVEFGYDPFTVRLYQQEHAGKSPPDNPRDAEWMRWRADKITDFMQKVYQAVKTVSPNCIISLSPNSQDYSYRLYLQDWQTWVQRGLVEELVVQVYRGDITTFVDELQKPALAAARSKIPVGVGISTGTWGRPVAMEQIEKQVQVARERGFNGVSFFYWESLWGYIAPESPPERRAAFQEIFSEPATRPKLLQKPAPAG